MAQAQKSALVFGREVTASGWAVVLASSDDVVTSQVAAVGAPFRHVVALTDGSLSAMVSVTSAGPVRLPPPVALPFTLTRLSGASMSLLTAVIVTTPVLAVAVAAMVSFVPVSVKSSARAPVEATGVTLTVTVTAVLSGTFRLAVTVAVPPPSDMEVDDRPRLTVCAQAGAGATASAAARSASAARKPPAARRPVLATAGVTAAVTRSGGWEGSRTVCPDPCGPPREGASGKARGKGRTGGAGCEPCREGATETQRERSRRRPRRPVAARSGRGGERQDTGAACTPPFRNGIRGDLGARPGKGKRINMNLSGNHVK